MVSLNKFNLFQKDLSEIGLNKQLINTLNAHSFNESQHDEAFVKALQDSDVLLPDGISVVLAVRWLTGERLKKIAGEDLFFWEMARMEKERGKVFFLGSSEPTLALIQERAAKEYPHIQVGSYSPAYKAEFTIEENEAMVAAVNAFAPDVLFIGMTAPKQEKWAYAHFEQLQAQHVCSIGAVFDFYAGTVKRAPKVFIKLGLEWFYRLIMEPRRMWRRYLIGNTKFIGYIIKEKFRISTQRHEENYSTRRQ